MLYPLRLAPVYKMMVWGGRRLASRMGRAIPPEEPIGESWEVSDHPHGRSIVTNGPETGKSLHALIATYGAQLLGTRVAEQCDGVFPLLVKYIDAATPLSVQVHPDNAYAQAHEGELGKTEMWYILHAEPGAELIVGLAEGATEAAMRAILTSGGDLGPLLHRVPVKAGDSIFIPAGRVHAIMPGIFLLEVQQNSDTTYRLYDWNRLGLDGKPRALHVDQGLAVIDWSDITPTPRVEAPTVLAGGNRKTELARCPFFVVEKYELLGEAVFRTDGGSFHIINCVAGEGMLTWQGGAESLSFGDSLLAPAELTEFSLKPINPGAGFVVSWVP